MADQPVGLAQSRKAPSTSDCARARSGGVKRGQSRVADVGEQRDDPRDREDQAERNGAGVCIGGIAAYIAAMSATDKPDLPDAAKRALAEAETRRQAADAPRPAEYGGRKGPDPVRYGDWEKKGLAIDF